MKLIETAVAGAYVMEPDLIHDERGFFARMFSKEQLESKGLKADIVQCNISYNKKKGTLRGMHYQIAPHEEVKIVRCTAGAIYDVIIDLRPHSPTFKKVATVVLSADNRKLLYVPEGVAHGYQTLDDDVEVFYAVTEYYHPESARGVRWNDDAFGIKWPLPVSVISKRDESFPAFQPNK